MRSLTVLDQAAVLPPGAVLAEVWDELRSGFESRPGPAVRACLRLRATEEDELRGAMQTMLAPDTDLHVVRRTDDAVEVEAVAAARAVLDCP